jgi:hypothetical protein
VPRAKVCVLQIQATTNMITSQSQDVSATDPVDATGLTQSEEPSSSLRRSPELANGIFLGTLAVLPLVSAGFAYASRGRSRWVRPLSVGAGVAAGLAAVRWQLTRLFTGQPAYEVERRVGDIEIRRYPAMVVAETTLSRRKWDGALDEGFRRLAGYIFGANASRESVDTTAPVTARREKIAMMAPVTALFHPAEEYTVAFVMPEGRDVASLPIPRDDRIHLRDVRPRRVAALRFRGTYRGAPVKDKIHDLLDKVDAIGLRPLGEPSFAGYDPPTTLPFLRRNEVWVEVMFA